MKIYIFSSRVGDRVDHAACNFITRAGAKR
jgi:hypothetical protein